MRKQIDRFKNWINGIDSAWKELGLVVLLVAVLAAVAFGIRSLPDVEVPESAMQPQAAISPGLVSVVGIYNSEETLFSSSGYTATANSTDQVNRGAGGAIIVFDVTGIVDTPSVVLKVQGKDPASLKYYTLITATAVTAASTNVYVVHNDVGAAGGDVTAVANYPVPRTWRVRMEHADSDVITYTVGIQYVP